MTAYLKMAEAVNFMCFTTQQSFKQEINTCDDPNHLCTNREEGDKQEGMFSFCGEACSRSAHSTHVSSEREKGLKPHTQGQSFPESKSGIKGYRRASVVTGPGGPGPITRLLPHTELL